MADRQKSWYGWLTDPKVLSLGAITALGAVVAVVMQDSTMVEKTLDFAQKNGFGNPGA